MASGTGDILFLCKVYRQGLSKTLSPEKQKAIFFGRKNSFCNRYYNLLHPSDKAMYKGQKIK
jgi:hypothetical protein